MKQLLYVHQASVSIAWAVWAWTRKHVAALVAPNGERPHRVKPRRPWLRILNVVAIVLALVIDVVALYVLGYMIDLCLSLMELWAELARKHLEITL
jgi:hypothetical protein